MSKELEKSKSWFSVPENKIECVLWGLITLIVILPLCFGGNRPLPASLAAVFSSVLLLIWAFAIGQKRSLSKVSLKHVWPIVLPFTIVMVWAILQAILPFGSGVVHPIWGLASNVLDRDLYSSISLNISASLFGCMKFASYGIVFWLALQIGRDKDNAKKILLAIVIAGGAYGLYGLVMHFTGIEKVLWYNKKYIGSLSSTFINRNSYATYSGLGLICSLVFITSTIFENTSHLKGKRYYYAIIENITKKTIWFLLVAILLISALILTDSRAGLFFVFVAVVSLFIFLGVFSSDKKKKRIILSFGVVLVIFFILILALKGNDFLHRLSTINKEVAMRLDLYKITLNAIKDAPFLGYGLGSFEDISVMYKNSQLTKYAYLRSNQAHNTYLEVILELGIPAFILLVTSVFYAIILCIKGMINRKRGKIYPIVAVASSVLIWLHALVDFSIEMPAIAVTYAAILGVGCAQSWSVRESMSDRKGKEL